MANLFDAANAPEGEPTKVVVGDFIQWKKSNLAQDYPTSAYSAEYVARITGGGSTEIKLAATEVDGIYLFTVDSATSSDFVAGHYYWQLEITQTSTGNRRVVERGDFEAIPDLDVNQSDPRSHAEIMLAKIESILEGKADSDVASYSIAGRSLSHHSFAELKTLREEYRAEVLREHRNALIKRGKPSQNTIKARFI
jgi:hypothetical protein